MGREQTGTLPAKRKKKAREKTSFLLIANAHARNAVCGLKRLPPNGSFDGDRWAGKLGAMAASSLEVAEAGSVRGSFRHACLRGAIAAMAFLVVVTEILSLCGSFTKGAVGAIWAAAVIGGAVWLRRRGGGAVVAVREAVLECSTGEKATLAVLIVFALGTACQAVLSPPNNYDSMTYHLPRIMHWLQQGSVAHYPTHIDRQVTQNPGAEFVLAHVRLLTGSDRWLNLLQWFCMVGSVVGCSLLARQLGAGRRGQWLAAAAATTLPMGLLQASSTQNDYVLAFTLVCLTSFVLETRGRQPQWRDAAWVGLAAGLAILVKGTAYLYIPPWLLLWAWFVRARLWPALGVAAVMALLLNAGHYARNQTWFGSPIGPTYSMRNDRLGLLGLVPLVSNLVRNAALHARTPWLPLNARVEHAIQSTYSRLGWRLDDPAVTWGATFPFELTAPERRATEEDHAGNPLHAFLVGCAVLSVIGRRPRLHPLQWWYVGAWAAMALLFCGVLKWQTWAVRLHLPWFVIAAPLLGVWLERLPRWLGRVLLAALIGYGALVMTQNRSRRLLGEPNNVFGASRDELTFAMRPDLREPFTAVCRSLNERKLSRVGVISESNSWEYPLWQLTDMLPGREIRHIQVENDSARVRRLAPRGEFVPDAIVVIDKLSANESQLMHGADAYRVILREGSMALFVRD
jgi:hypothetical protein